MTTNDIAPLNETGYHPNMRSASPDVSPPRNLLVPVPPRLVALSRALRHRNYRLFFLGQMISLVGTWMQTVAQSWLIYRLTGSAELLGLAGFAAQGPVLALATLGGVVADRVDRHRILLATQGASMVLASTLAILTLTGLIQVWEVFVLAALLGTINAFDIPARQSFVVEMVGRDDLPNAIALNSSIFNGARLLGPAIAGALVASVGEGLCFLINAVSFIAVLAGLLAMDHRPVRRPPSRTGLVETVREGFTFVAGHTPIRSILLLLSVSSLSGMSYMVLMPIFADRILGGGAAGLGTLMSASGLGALTAALVLASRTSIAGLGNWIAGGAMGFGCALVLFGLSPWFWVSALILVVIGFSFMAQMAASNTLVQAMVPDEYRGRTMALYSMMFMGMAPIGALISGWLAGRIGVQECVMLGGGVCLVGGVVFRCYLPVLRREGRRLMAQTHPAQPSSEA